MFGQCIIIAQWGGGGGGGKESSCYTNLNHLAQNVYDYSTRGGGPFMLL